MTVGRTGSQTVGPFFNFALLRPGENDLTRTSQDAPQAKGEVLEIGGRVLDGDGKPCPRVLVEIWAADAEGRYPGTAEADPNFAGFGRTLTDTDGYYSFTIVQPGRVPGRGNAWQAPHASLRLFASGLLKPVATRIYFPDDPSNAEDPILAGIDDEAVRATLIAQEVSAGPPRNVEFDVVLQGEGETAFFAI